MFFGRTQQVVAQTGRSLRALEAFLSRHTVADRSGARRRRDRPVLMARLQRHAPVYQHVDPLAAFSAPPGTRRVLMDTRARARRDSGDPATAEGKLVGAADHGEAGGR
jgi:hypothetical protein